MAFTRASATFGVGQSRSEAWAESPCTSMGLTHLRHRWAVRVLTLAVRSLIQKDSRYSGFGLTYNYGALSPGEHTMTIRAHGLDGSVTESSSTFTVASFHSEFFRQIVQWT